MDSLWSDADRTEFPGLKEDAETDVLVIGGGIAGILCAYKLKEAGVDCVLAEARRICGGTTGGMTAKITVQHGLIYDKLIRRFGREKAGLYLEAQKRAAEEYSALCRDIPCDYEIKNSYVYSKNDRRAVEREINALKTLGARAEYSNADALPFPTAGAVTTEGQAQFHPLKFLYGIAKGLRIYENTKITGMMPGKAFAGDRVISCKRTVLATHFPILNKHGGYFLKMYQHRTYMLALENAAGIGGMYVDEADKGMSFRDYGDVLLIGGGDHRTGKSGGNPRELEAFAERYYGGARVVGRWAAQDCMTLDGVPYVGRYSKSTEGLYVVTGFNKWGTTNAMAAASLIRDLLTGKENRFAGLFDPSRSILRPQLAVNALETAAGLLTPTVPRCPHLGCALKYNGDERSWDCPCHGSRFTENGRLIDGPATGDLKAE